MIYLRSLPGEPNHIAFQWVQLIEAADLEAFVPYPLDVCQGGEWCQVTLPWISQGGDLGHSRPGRPPGQTALW